METDSSVAATEAPASSTATAEVRKIKVQLVAVGNAPILKNQKFQVRDSMTVGEVLLLIRERTKIPESDAIFLYINSSFAPGLDQTLGQLHASFQVNDQLLLQFALTNTWG
ncbi:hypothetical protein BASA81_001556 [Batrachochytrium salamandrivorans]|nr:hypothetical protein BASA81_001556 [Batrachochytrium salamandrivorans]